jgi:hypothetical protein
LKPLWLLVPVIIIAAGVVVDMLVADHGEDAGVFSFPGFWSVFGLAGSLVLAGACKLAAKLFLKRPENYYNDVL